MAEARQLSRPPLREALIDLQLTEEMPVSFLEGLKRLDLGSLAIKSPIRRGQFSFQLAIDRPAAASVSSEEELGWRFEKADGSGVALIRRNGITISILKNYRNWEELQGAARLVWEKYQELGISAKVSRMAVRYINVIQVPIGSDYDEYLTAGPRVPPELPQAVGSFLQRVVVLYNREYLEAIITHAMEPPSDRVVPLILDIDVYQRQVLACDSTEVWDTFDVLRAMKNEIFFASVTEKALEAYQ